MGLNPSLVRGDFREVICDICGRNTGNMYTTDGKEEVGDYDLCLDCLMGLPYALFDDDDDDDDDDEEKGNGKDEEVPVDNRSRYRVILVDRGTELLWTNDLSLDEATKHADECVANRSAEEIRDGVTFRIEEDV